MHDHVCSKEIQTLIWSCWKYKYELILVYSMNTSVSPLLLSFFHHQHVTESIRATRHSRFVVQLTSKRIVCVLLTSKQPIKEHLKALIGEQHYQHFQWGFSYSRCSRLNSITLRWPSFHLACPCSWLRTCDIDNSSMYLIPQFQWKRAVTWWYWPLSPALLLFWFCFCWSLN